MRETAPSQAKTRMHSKLKDCMPLLAFPRCLQLQAKSGADGGDRSDPVQKQQYAATNHSCEQSLKEWRKA